MSKANKGSKSTTKQDTKAAAPVARVSDPNSVAAYARAHGLNPKTVRAKLRRAVANGTLKVDHTHGGSWSMTVAPVKAFVTKASTKAA